MGFVIAGALFAAGLFLLRRRKSTGAAADGRRRWEAGGF